MNEGTLGVHQIELVIDAGEDLSNRGGVGDHAAGAHNLGQVAAGDNSGGLVVDTALESSGRPVDELDGSLGLDFFFDKNNLCFNILSSIHISY